jgi:hypothetical protein
MNLRTTEECSIAKNALGIYMSCKRVHLFCFLLSSSGRESSFRIATGYGLDGQGSSSVRGEGLSSTAFTPALKPTQPPTQWLPGTYSPRAKRLGRDGDHSTPSSREVKNGGAIPLLPIRLYGVVLN